MYHSVLGLFVALWIMYRTDDLFCCNLMRDVHFTHHIHVVATQIHKCVFNVFWSSVCFNTVGKIWNENVETFYSAQQRLWIPPHVHVVLRFSQDDWLYTVGLNESSCESCLLEQGDFWNMHVINSDVKFPPTLFRSVTRAHSCSKTSAFSFTCLCLVSAVSFPVCTSCRKHTTYLM